MIIDFVLSAILIIGAMNVKTAAKLFEILLIKCSVFMSCNQVEEFIVEIFGSFREVQGSVKKRTFEFEDST